MTNRPQPRLHGAAPIDLCNSSDIPVLASERTPRWLWRIPVAVALTVFIGNMFAPPHLMDDVDGVQAQIALNMLRSGDWVTPRLNGIVDFEKPPMLYWMIALSYSVFGVADWAARLPVAISAVLLCWLVARIGSWGFGERMEALAGVCLATSAGLFLFSRILFHDIPLTLATTLAIWAAVRAVEPAEPRSVRWAVLFWSALAAGVLIKGFVALVLPVGTLSAYLLLTGALLRRSTWQKLRPGIGLAILLALAGPWHLLAIWRRPPYFDLSLQTEAGRYRGFFWFYFINEHVLRFLNLRYPRDYTSIPAPQFILLHLVWLFPWSAYTPVLRRLEYRGQDRASRTRLLALC